MLRIVLYLGVIIWLTGCASTGINKPEHPANTEDSVYPQAAATTQIAPELLIEELDIIKQKLLSIHPQPFARLPRAEFESQFDLLKSTLNYPLSRSEFYLRIAPLLAGLRDVHSFVNLPKDQFGDFKYRGEKLFPLALIVQNSRFYVAVDLSEQPEVPSGAQLISVNQAPVEFLLNVMQALTSRETLNGQNRKIQMDFSWLLSAMGYASDIYDVEYLLHGKRYQVKIRGLELAGKNRTATAPVTYYGFSKLTTKTALLWLNDFNENPEVFDRYLNGKFDQMERNGVDNLILDLRYNSGGLSENLRNLLSRITDNPIHWATQGTIKVSENLKKNHRRKTHQRREDKYHWSLQWLPFEWTDALQHTIWWATPGETINVNLKPIEPSELYKPKRVWVLTNGYCYSACSFFIASVNHYQLGKTIGEKPGSLARFQFAYPINFKLPHSGLTLTLPTMRLDFTASELQDLILPQQIIERTHEDIEVRRDPVLSHALREAESYYQNRN